MSQFHDQQAVVDRLEREFSTVRSESMARFVVVRSPPGWGKTFAVQRFYERLAAKHQGTEHYWPARLTDSTGLGSRKVTHPDRFTHRAGLIPQWLWWGAACSLEEGQRSLAVLKSNEAQIVLHSEAIVRQLTTRTRNERDALELASALLGLMPVPDVVGAVMAASDLGRKLYRISSEQVRRRRLRTDQMVREVKLGEPDQAAAREWAIALSRVLSGSMPLVLFLEDAHAMDPTTAQMLVELADLNAPALLILTTWTESRLDDSERARLAALEAGVARRGRAASWTVLDLGSPETPMLENIIKDFAPATRGDLVAKLVERCGGNPLVLHLLLGVQSVRRSVRDGALELDADDLQRLPSHVLELWNRIWWDLDDGHRLALVLFALQGEESVELSTRRARDELDLPFDSDDLAELVDAFGWLLALDDVLRAFRERILFDVALENAESVFGHSRLKTARVALVRSTAALLSAADTPMSPRAREATMRAYVRWTRQGFDETDRALAAACARALAEAAETRSDLDAALELAADSRRWNPDDLDALEIEGRLLLRFGRPAEAQAPLSALHARRNDERSLLLLATCTHELGLHAEAMVMATDLERRTSQSSDRESEQIHLEAIRLLGNVSFWLDDRRAEGEELLRKAIELNDARAEPDRELDATLHRNLVPYANSRGDREEARRLRAHVLDLRSAILGPNHPDVLDARGSLTKSHLLLGETQRARLELMDLIAARMAVFGGPNIHTFDARRVVAVIDLDDAELRDDARDELHRLSEEVAATSGIAQGVTQTFADWARLSRIETLPLEEIRHLLLEEQVWGPEHPVVVTIRSTLIDAAESLDPRRPGT